MSFEIRSEATSDVVAIHQLHRSAFGGDGEARLVDLLRAAGALTISLVAIQDAEVVGHVAFSPVQIGDGTNGRVLALAPVAVRPDRQRQGIGSRLIQAGLAAARHQGAELVIVLGHHDYYPKFGFVTARPHGISCPYEVPEEAFMVLELQPGSLGRRRGQVQYHAAFAEL